MDAMASCGVLYTVMPAFLKIEYILILTSSISRMFSVNWERMGMTGFLVFRAASTMAWGPLSIWSFWNEVMKSREK